MRVLVVVLLCVVAGVGHADDADATQSAIGYRYGKRIRITLAPAGHTWLEVRTARDFAAMKEAARADGIDLYLYSGFRTHERQTQLYLAWRAGWGNRAARPGYSLHQSGRALDLYVGDQATRDWLGKHARKFGFRRTVGDEPWHFEHAPVKRYIARGKVTAKAKSVGTR